MTFLFEVFLWQTN